MENNVKDFVKEVKEKGYLGTLLNHCDNELCKKLLKIIYQVATNPLSEEDIDNLKKLIDNELKDLQLEELPNEVNINQDELNDEVCEEIIDFINDYLADVYGYCNNGFSYNVNIEIEDIDWDLEE